MSQIPASARTALYCAAIVISLAGIKVAATIVVPFLLSLFVAIICNPAVNFLAERKIPRGIAISLVIAFIFLLFILLGGVIGSSVSGFRSALPSYEAQLSNEMNWIINWMASHNVTLSMTEIRAYFDPSKIMGLVTSTLSGFSSVLGLAIDILGGGTLYTIQSNSLQLVSISNAGAGSIVNVLSSNLIVPSPVLNEPYSLSFDPNTDQIIAPNTQIEPEASTSKIYASVVTQPKPEYAAK